MRRSLFNAGHLCGAHLEPTPVEARGRKTEWAEGEFGCDADPTALGALCHMVLQIVPHWTKMVSLWTLTLITLWIWTTPGRGMTLGQAAPHSRGDPGRACSWSHLLARQLRVSFSIGTGGTVRVTILLRVMRMF